MRVNQICSRTVESAPRNVSVLDAARRMREGHVGDLVIVDQRDGRKIPVGMITDRDLVVTVLARDAEHIRMLDAGDIMGDVLITASEDEDLEDVLRRMQSFAIRRLPIVDRQGALVGILSVDDIVIALSDEIARLADLVSLQQRRERRERP
jgi:CBS domain-containing protein